MVWSTLSKQARGYGAKWETTRKRILMRDGGICQCFECKRHNRVRIANQVDHVVSKAQGKLKGWTEAQIEADSNLQSINAECHRIKTAADCGYVLKVPSNYQPKQKIITGPDGWPAT